MRCAFILAALMVIVISGCGGDDGEQSAGDTTTIVRTVTSTQNPTGTSSVTVSGKFQYPPVVVNNFMDSCTDGMQNRRSYCACTLDQLSNNVSVKDFARIGLAGGKLPPRIQSIIQRAAVDCADKLPG
jgi:hypothetical protein